MNDYGGGDDGFYGASAIAYDVQPILITTKES